MSNFQEARNLEGQKNTKGYQAGVSMSGTIQALIDPQRIFTTNGKPTQRIKLLDDLGESLTVKVFLGNGPDILQTDVKTVQQFTDLAMNRYKGRISYMAFWDNMHPPQGQPQATQLTPETQRIIDQRLRPDQAAEQIMDHMGGTQPTDPSVKHPEPPTPTQEDYKAKEREKVIGMCFTNLLSARLQNTFAHEIVEDIGELQAIWQLANMCIDGLGQILDKEPNF